MIEAKAVVPNQFWILRKDNQKIGNIEVAPGGYLVNLNGTTTKVKTLQTLTRQVDIDFKTIPVKKATIVTNQVHGYPTTSKPYNAIFDVKHQLPLWTRDARSKSWQAAGWYKIQQHRSWHVAECPKLIMLERYAFKGPFFTKEEAESS
jgi:hypothetical protein